jgi:neutral ceramidase
VEIGVNRRQRLADGRVIIGENPGGATDPELLVLRIDALGEPGQPLALLVNYACHAVCLGSNNYAISADWPGVMRRTVEAETGALVGFVQGAGADINPLGGPQDTFASAQRLGTEIAQACLRLVPQVGLEAEIELRGVSRTLELDLERTGAERPAWEALVARALGLSPHEAAALLDRRFPWSAPVQRRDGGWTTPAEIQVFRLGDVALAAVGAEPFVEIGRQVKRRSPARVTLFAGYTNGSVGYLPTPAAYEDGGYEVDSSYAYYRLPAPLAPTCAAQVVDEILSAIDLVIVKNID